LQASNRLSARLIFDGVISFAFIPVVEMLSLAIVYRRAPRRVPLAQAMDAFFVANAPWLLWLLVFVAICAFQTPEQATGLPIWWMWTLEISLIPFAAWTVYLDVRFFASISSRAGDVALQRLISWPCSVLYFIGHDGTTFFRLFVGWQTR
jgi:hypothetical protein